MKAQKVWVLIADGARARVVRSLPADDDAAGKLEDLVFEAEHKPLREIMSDRPGRSFASHGARRSAMEYHSDPVRIREEGFAAMLAGELMERQDAGEFDTLSIIAEPRMLGLIRRNIPSSRRDLIAGEVAKDLTKLPPRELRNAILELGIAGLR